MLTVNSLTVTYNTVPAVNNVNFTVNDSETVGIIGLNGAGKTTLMKAIAGVVHSQGQIMFDQNDISHTPSHQRTKLKISLVPEGRHLFPQMTVLENLKVAETSKQALCSVYETFPQLKPLAFKKAGQLSGGQQQLIAIARAIISNPKLLLLDEMTMGLSPKLTEQIFDTIYNIRRNFNSIIITGQEIDRITAISDRVYIMKNGTLSECDKHKISVEKIF